ncbi:protein DA1-related 2 [Cocos nucifera]|uniref:Protein DA1-related 2 n=1 Tax=Cocos nucifera TaxID=13894 RepID=A0A8K0I4P8_COCNU|nr:protein DA1-related 2 [Cocos nucifera]
MASPSDSTFLSDPCIYGHTTSSYSERKYRFMKWLCKIFKGTSRGASNGRRPQAPGENIFWNEPVRSTDDQPKAENEEMDHAIALSLAEDDKKRNGHTTSSYSERKYRFMKWLCKIFKGTSRGASNGRRPQAPGENIFWNEPVRSTDDQPKAENEEMDHAIALSLAEDDKKRNGKTASGCNGMGNDDEDLARALHESLNMSSLQPYTPIQYLPRGYRDYYEGMNMKIDQQIPMLLVERQALNEAMEGEKDGHYHMPETRGLCLSEEQTILKRPKIGENRICGVRTHPQKLTRKCEVTAILVLYGLPRLLTGSILAHELMHAWLRLKGYRNLSPEVEEGICQVLSHMWLESEVMPGSRNIPSSSSFASSSSSSFPSSKKAGKSDIEKKLGGFFIHQIAHDTSSAYGEGFRTANEAVNKFGLRRTLDHIRWTGNLPM